MKPSRADLFMNHSNRTQAPTWAMLAMVFLCVPAAMADSSNTRGARAVVELFTSQGCSSCPPADAVAGRLRAVPDLLVLSFHVNYWDGLGWKDPFASQASTDRQDAYVRSLGEHSMFTPQVIVNGAVSLVGSREGAIKQAVAAADSQAFPVQAELTQQADGSFELSLQGMPGGAPASGRSTRAGGRSNSAGSARGADVWEIRYVKYAATQIRGGENGGRTLETYNNVTQLRRLGAFAPGTLHLPPLNAPDDGLAIIVQSSGVGEVLGAAAY
jgi:hypothetical protein